MSDVAVLESTGVAHLARDKILRLEDEVGALQQVDLPLRHYFSRGVYARELTIPAGVVLVGKIHKFSQINILLKGEMSVLTDDGVKRVRAPFVFESPPGVKRAGFAHEDSVWMTVHGTNETDLDRLEDELIAKSFEEFDRLCAAEQPRLESEGS